MNRPINPEIDFYTEHDVIICADPNCSKHATVYNDTTDDMYCDDHAPKE